MLNRAWTDAISFSQLLEPIWYPIGSCPNPPFLRVAAIGAASLVLLGVTPVLQTPFGLLYWNPFLDSRACPIGIPSWIPVVTLNEFNVFNKFHVFSIHTGFQFLRLLHDHACACGARCVCHPHSHLEVHLHLAAGHWSRLRT